MLEIDDTVDVMTSAAVQFPPSVAAKVPDG
jgi:hypothetical protein